MSRPEIAPTSSADVKATTAALERSLRRLRLTSPQRETILEEVRGDLAAAASNGVDPRSLIGPDTDAFAAEAAAARGYPARRGSYARILLAGVAGALAALVAGYLLIVYVLYPLVTSAFDLGGFHPVLGAYVAMSAVALATTAGILGALALALRGRTGARATLARAAVLVPAAAAVGLVLVGRAVMDLATPNPAYLQAIGARAAVAIALLAAALLTARAWALRPAPTHTPPAS